MWYHKFVFTRNPALVLTCNSAYNSISIAVKFDIYDGSNTNTAFTLT
jgi:hypothetical protein